MNMKINRCLLITQFLCGKINSVMTLNTKIFHYQYYDCFRGVRLTLLYLTYFHNVIYSQDAIFILKSVKMALYTAMVPWQFFHKHHVHFITPKPLLANNTDLFNVYTTSNHPLGTSRYSSSASRADCHSHSLR